MLLTISRKFRLGRDLDDELSSMQQPKPKQDSGELAKIQAAQQQLEKAKGAFVLQQVAGKAQMDSQSSSMKIQALQHGMQAQKTTTQALLANVQSSVKDGKTKMELTALIKELDTKHQQMQGDAAAIGDHLQLTREKRMTEHAAAMKEADHHVQRATEAMDHAAQNHVAELARKHEDLARATKEKQKAKPAPARK